MLVGVSGGSTFNASILGERGQIVSIAAVSGVGPPSARASPSRTSLFSARRARAARGRRTYSRIFTGVWDSSGRIHPSRSQLSACRGFPAPGRPPRRWAPCSRCWSRRPLSAARARTWPCRGGSARSLPRRPGARGARRRCSRITARGRSARSPGPEAGSRDRRLRVGRRERRCRPASRRPPGGRNRRCGPTR